MEWEDFKTIFWTPLNGEGKDLIKKTIKESEQVQDRAKEFLFNLD